MANIRWQAICSCCGKGGSIRIKSESSGAPQDQPVGWGGICPSSPDRKHKPKWEMIGKA